MTEKAEKDLVLWRQWDTGGQKSGDLEPLLDAFEPVINSHLRRYAGHVNIPEPTIHADLENRFVRALQTFDPNRGAQLATHVNWHLKGVHGFVAQHQNIARIPEHQLSKIKDLTAAVHEAQEELGKVPDNAVLASRLNWSPTQVKKLRRSLRKDLLAPAFQVPIGGIVPSRWEEMKSLLPAELSPKEKFVFEHTLGIGKKPVIKAIDMAKRLHTSNAGISRLRSAVAKKIEMYGAPGPVGIRAIRPFVGEAEPEEDFE